MIKCKEGIAHCGKDQCCYTCTFWSKCKFACTSMDPVLLDSDTLEPLEEDVLKCEVAKEWD